MGSRHAGGIHGRYGHARGSGGGEIQGACQGACVDGIQLVDRGQVGVGRGRCWS